MEKVIHVLKNRWLRLGVSFLSLGYCFFVGWVAWLAFAYYLVPTNSASLFSLYLLVNFLFGSIMFYTRKSFPTMLVACVAPLEVFVLLILGFGQWYMIVPPLVIVVVTFFAAANTESLKTVLGTIYLMMFVVGTLVYLTLQTFNLSINSLLTNEEYDINLRSLDYEVSPSGTYRLVTYIDEGEDEHRSVSYYVEKTEEDMELWFLDCYRVFGCRKVLVTVYQNDISYRWVSDNQLLIDGKIRDMDELFSDEEENLITMPVSVSVIKEAAIEETTDTAE